MFKRAGVLFLYTLTPLHAGSGGSIAAVDLPIQRERPTGFPIIQASGVKGALRYLAERMAANGEDRRRLELVFGPETERAAEHAGALSLTDARVLLFPVRSARGVFTWVTCPTVLWRFARDLEVVRSAGGDLAMPPVTVRPGPGEAATPPRSRVVLPDGQHLLLEDLCFAVITDAQRRKEVGGIADWLAGNALPAGLEYWQEKLRTDLVVLSDDDFREFVELATETITRVKLGASGTVEEGPWDEEHLPAETLLYSLALATDPRARRDEREDALRTAEEVLAYLARLLGVNVVQFGGDETVGKGLVRVRYTDRQPTGGGHGGGDQAGRAERSGAAPGPAGLGGGAEPAGGARP